MRYELDVDAITQAQIKLEAENKRLREALEKITKYAVTSRTPRDEICHINAPVAVAKLALKERDDE